MKIPTESCRQIPKALSRLGALALTGFLLLFSLLTVGCRTSLERMAQKEIEKRPVSRVYLSGVKYFEDLMNQGKVPGVKSPESVVQQPSEDLMTEEEMKEVKYPFRMTVRLKKKDDEKTLYGYTLLKETPTADWKIVKAWRGQIAVQNKVDLLQKSADATQ